MTSRIFLQALWVLRMRDQTNFLTKISRHALMNTIGLVIDAILRVLTSIVHLKLEDYRRILDEQQQAWSEMRSLARWRPPLSPSFSTQCQHTSRRAIHKKSHYQSNEYCITAPGKILPIEILVPHHSLTDARKSMRLLPALPCRHGNYEAA